jgi:Cof subfamily protein (haloacid dehalogenase superfamily)
VPDIKLVALDLDDTLLRTDLTISPRAQAAIKKAVALGTAVTFATGRMYKSARPFAVELGLDLPLITYVGALVKYVDGREVYHRPLSLETAGKIIDFLLPYKYHINIYINDELYMEKESPEGARYANISKVPVHFVNDLRETLQASPAPTKILALSGAPEIAALLADIQQAFGGQVHITRSKPYFLEISDLGATKGQALAGLARSLNLTAGQVMAIGDSWNDLDMIEYAGIGVAMGNAEAEVKAAAQYITLNNDDDGVAEAIEKFVINRNIK